MPVIIRGERDDSVEQVAEALRGYESEHPSARIELYRYSPVSIRVRVLDSDFVGIDRTERHDILWESLEGLDESIQSQVSLLLALTPEEAPRSFASVEFDDPVPSRL
jgi:hypothetical protein